MIVVKIEMWPKGIEAKKYGLGEMRIANDGAGTHARGDYDVVLMKGERLAKRPGLWRRTRVVNFPRSRLGVYDLIFRALAASVGARNPDVNLFQEIDADMETHAVRLLEEEHEDHGEEERT